MINLERTLLGNWWQTFTKDMYGSWKEHKHEDSVHPVNVNRGLFLKIKLKSWLISWLSPLHLLAHLSSMGSQMKQPWLQDWRIWMNTPWPVCFCTNSPICQYHKPVSMSGYRWFSKALHQLPDWLHWTGFNKESNPFFWIDFYFSY